MAATVTHRRNTSGEITDRFCSPAIWSDFPHMERQRDPSRYFHHFDDFDNLPDLSADANTGLYATYIDTSDTIRGLTTGEGRGVLRMSVAATDNNAPVLQMNGIAASLLISDTAGDDMPLWFEARWRKSLVTDNGIGVFVGIAEEALTADNGVLTDDDAVLADKDHIGFNVAHDNGEELNWAYTKSGQTDTEVIAAMDSLAADTWVKTGMVYGPKRYASTGTGFTPSKRIKAFLNNVEQTTYVTDTNIAAATFPDGEEMTVTLAAKVGAAAAATFDCDWFRIAQEKQAD